MPDYRPDHKIMGTKSPINGNWRSPFVEASISDAANFIRNTHKPPKPLCKRFFAVLQKEFYEMSGQALICRISPGDDVDAIIGDWNKEQGVQSFKEAGRSLMCQIVSDTESLGTENAANDKDEFKVEMIGYDATRLGLFFSAFDRHSWWECGGSDMH